MALLRHLMILFSKIPTTLPLSQDRLYIDIERHHTFEQVRVADGEGDEKE